MNPDDQNYRKKVWEIEYEFRKELPSSKTDFPSRALKDFLDNIKPVNRDSALDLGSGNGRNSIFLALQGYGKVVGVEFVKFAVDQANEKAKISALENQVEFINQSVGENLDFTDNSFDLIVDMMVMHSMTLEDRNKMVKEIQRLLKPGGYFVFYTIAAESEAAQDLIRKDPGPEENSYRFPVGDDIVTEKAFTQDELKEMFSELEVVSLVPKEEFTPAFGDVYKRIYYSGVFRKP